MTRRFFYHAFGVGLGGRITRPCCEVIDGGAMAALPTVGGYASSRVDGYRFRDILSVRSAAAYAVGSEDGDKAYNTSVTVTVEGLNILDVITADSITARLTSRHASDGDEPVISTVGTEFRNLRIDGAPVDVEIQNRDLFFTERTASDFNERARAIEQAEASAKTGTPRFLFGTKGVTMCSLVKSESYAIRVPTVGTVYLGEILVSGYARRLTMVRVEMGSPVGGRAEFASGEVNGSTYP